MKNRSIGLALAGLLLIGSLAGCGATAPTTGANDIVGRTRGRIGSVGGMPSLGIQGSRVEFGGTTLRAWQGTSFQSKINHDLVENFDTLQCRDVSDQLKLAVDFTHTQNSRGEPYSHHFRSRIDGLPDGYTGDMDKAICVRDNARGRFRSLDGDLSIWHCDTTEGGIEVTELPKLAPSGSLLWRAFVLVAAPDGCQKARLQTAVPVSGPDSVISKRP